MERTLLALATLLAGCSDPAVSPEPLWMVRPYELEPDNVTVGGRGYRVVEPGAQIPARGAVLAH